MFFFFLSFYLFMVMAKRESKTRQVYVESNLFATSEKRAEKSALKEIAF